MSLENIRASQFHAQLGNLERLRFKKTRLIYVHASRMWVHQPDMRHAPGPMLLKLVANLGEPVIEKRNFDGVDGRTRPLSRRAITECDEIGGCVHLHCP